MWRIVCPLLLAASATAQTTQGVIRGRVFDSDTRAAIQGAIIECYNAGTNAVVRVRSDARGYYTVAFASTGAYSLRVSANHYAARQIRNQDLPVAGHLQIDFPLYPLSLFDPQDPRFAAEPSAPVVDYLASDTAIARVFQQAPVQTSLSYLQATVSSVIDPMQIGELPLSSRDIYSTLVLQPGVTADLSTARGLGLSINGQRPSSSNYLLDGVENNDYISTGPSIQLPPEAIAEYRVSINNFSAEFGRTAGFIANAVTIPGGRAVHGLVYAYLNRQGLNANSFARNSGNCGDVLRDCGRLPFEEHFLGIRVGGPILKERLFASLFFEQYGQRGQDDSKTFTVPSLANIQACPALPQTGNALTLLKAYQPPSGAPRLGFGEPQGCAPLSAQLNIAQPISVVRSTFLGRMDYPKLRDRFMGRLAISASSDANYIFSPYKDFSSPLLSHSLSLGGLWTHSAISGRITSEFRMAYRNSDVHWDRRHAQVPTLISGDGVSLPGSPAAYAYGNGDSNFEFADSIGWTRGPHLLTAGAGALLRWSSSLLSFGRDGIYSFEDVTGFARNIPIDFQSTISGSALPSLEVPDFHRAYRNNQYYGFVQDSIKLTSRLNINVGLRYESFGNLKNTGTQDAYILPGGGPTIVERIEGANLTLDPTQRQAPYLPDRNNWAPRFGITAAPSQQTVFRAAYGLFYDRPIDNLTENTRFNDLLLLLPISLPPNFNYLLPVSQVLKSAPINPANDSTQLPERLWVDRNLRTPYVQSWFAGMQRRVAQNVTAEVNYMGAVGRKLITTDLVNRLNSAGPDLRYKQSLGDLLLRSNSGASSYEALTAVLRYRGKRSQAQVAYTWSHSLDNQSEPLLGDFFNLNSIAHQSGGLRPGLASFLQQTNSSLDRGSSDFDQRHNLVFFSIVQLPSPSEGWWRRLFGNWRLSQTGGFRSGLPYTVYAGDGKANVGQPPFGDLSSNRARLLPGRSATLSESTPVKGGRQLLDPAAFAPPAPGITGTLGRNSLIGPGFWNVDLSLAKSVTLRWLGEAGQLQFRADAYNVFNHANLGNPDAVQTSATFGQAKFGRLGLGSNYQPLTPLDETPRRVQLQLKLNF